MVARYRQAVNHKRRGPLTLVVIYDNIWMND